MASQDADDDEDDLAKKGSAWGEGESPLTTTRVVAAPAPPQMFTNQNENCDSLSELRIETDNHQPPNFSCRSHDHVTFIDNNNKISSSSTKFANIAEDEDEEEEEEGGNLVGCPEEVKRWLLNTAQPEHLEQLLQIVARKKAEAAVAAAGAAAASTQQQPQQRRRRPERRRASSVELTAAADEKGDSDNDEGGDGDDAQSNELLPTKRNSVTSDLFQLWLSTSPVKRAKSPNRGDTGQERRRRLHQLTEADLFMELIRDVANELDIDVLCHKILVNVGLLTHADRGSLFLARGPRDQRYLHAKLFDVTVDTALEEAVQKARTEEIRIPFGVGIAGLVAQSKQPINIRDAYEDPRFNSAIDLRTGYRTHAILCMPICNYEGEVIGVAQIINKTDGSREFTDRDVEVFRRYLTFCGIGLQNAQLFELSVLEFRRNQILLNLARSIFEEQNNLECLVTKIMTEARELLKCERCAVFLLESAGDEAAHITRIGERPSQGSATSSSHLPLGGAQTTDVPVDDILEYRLSTALEFARIFELESPRKSAAITANSEGDSPKKSDPMLTRVARYVAATGQIVNIADASRWAHSARSVLSMPIVNGQKAVIGVAQLINKGNGSAFSECDVSILEAFAIFCGLGIHNTQMYENACKLMAKQRVALECLSYHATASTDDTSRLAQDQIPTAHTFNLFSFNFVDFDLSDEDTCRAAVRMFLQCDLVQRYHIPYPVLCRWILSVKKNYRPVKYHNWRHALNVAQTMFAMLKTGKMDRFMTDLEILGLLVACLCHDLDHRGTNNAFQTKTDSPLAVLYSTSTMEHHHFDQCVMILNSEGNNLFQSLSTDDYRRVMRVVESAIISTDLAMYFKKKSQFLKLLDDGEFDWQSPAKKELLCGMMMTACDVSAIAKPWEIQHRIAKLVADEFFEQGDLEKLQLNQQPMAMMDRERKDELPQMQVDFIDHICLPLYKTLSEAFPWIHPLYDGCLSNRQNWQDLAEKVNMGLTWIDHDYIDKPVEAFMADSEPKDIEFTVTTLNTKPVQSCSGPTSDGPTAVIRSGLQRLTSIRKQQMRLPSSIHGRPASGNQQQNSPVSPPPSSEKQNATTNATTTTFDANNSINNTPAAMMTTNNDKTLHLQQPRKAKSPKCVKPPKCSLI